MENNVFIIREEEIGDTTYSLGRAEQSIEDTKRDFPYQFRGMKESGLFANGVDKINKQMENITNTIFNVKEKIKKHSNEVFDMERMYDKRAQEIEIPQDFVKNDSKKVNTIDDIYLSKNDGLSVNNGENINIINELEEYDINEQKLGSIVSNNGLKEEKYDSSSILERENLGSINNGKDTEKVNNDEETEVENKNLEAINNSSNLQNINYDDNINLNNVSVRDINNDFQNEKEIELELELEEKNNNSSNNTRNDSYEMDVLNNDNKSESQ